MNFRTSIEIPPQQPQIGLKSQLLSLGSCFSDRIGQKLQQNKFQIRYNPFGVLFNPISIFKLIELAHRKRPPVAHHFVEQQGLWHHFDFHSQYFASSKEALQQQLHQALSDTALWLTNTNFLILTFGTAWVHQYKKSGELVANCHKVPSTNFDKRLLQLNELEQAFDNFIQYLPEHTHILLTVSPIRHIKESLPLNQVSKSLLRVFCHQMVEKHAQVSYFPSYELLLDDLRDYRFYKDDLIHPSDFAIEYIWKKFSHAHLDADSQEFMKSWQKIVNGLNHRPLHPNAKAHQTFLLKLKNDLHELADKVDVNQELQQVQQALDRFD